MPAAPEGGLISFPRAAEVSAKCLSHLFKFYGAWPVAAGLRPGEEAGAGAERLRKPRGGPPPGRARVRRGSQGLPVVWIQRLGFPELLGQDTPLSLGSFPTAPLPPALGESWDVRWNPYLGKGSRWGQGEASLRVPGDANPLETSAGRVVSQDPNHCQPHRARQATQWLWVFRVPDRRSGDYGWGSRTRKSESLGRPQLFPEKSVVSPAQDRSIRESYRRCRQETV